MRRKQSLWQRRGGSLLLSTIALLGLYCVFTGCQGLPPYIANCTQTPTPPANTSVVPPAVEPPPAAVCGFPLTISNLTNGASVTSPVNIVATATPYDPLYWLRIYVDGQAVMYSPNENINQYIWVPDGAHTLEIVGEDTSGYIATSTLQLNVTAQTQGIANIQNLPVWTSCSAVIEGGATCAAGLGVASSTLVQNQSQPSLDGSSAEFTMGGSTPYSNELYWAPLGGGNNVSHFTYDLYFYVSDGSAPQALEFDVNQVFGGTRWTWGSECDFNQTHLWNIWDPLHEIWVPTSVACDYFPSNTWVHLIWTLERVGNQVHYMTLNVADQTYNIDTYYTAQPNWDQEGIDIAFQMDGNYKQQPYNVWLDEVNLSAY